MESESIELPIYVSMIINEQRTASYEICLSVLKKDVNSFLKSVIDQLGKN